MIRNSNIAAAVSHLEILENNPLIFIHHFLKLFDTILTSFFRNRMFSATVTALRLG